jgi:hypothetical protein
MINLYTAIFAINPSIVTIRGDIAYDANEKEVPYDMEQAQAKLIELQALDAQKEQIAKDAKASALDKLAKLGLTDAEITALVG